MAARPAAKLNSDDFLPDLRGRAIRLADECKDEKHELRVIISALCDLFSKGWLFYLNEVGAFTQRPQNIHGEPIAEKERVRAALVYERDNQLRNASTAGFIRSMERRRLGPVSWCSIYSLMRDGRHLAAALREAAREPKGESRIARLKSVIDPYLQFADSGKDRFTGFALGDVWRYFRYTWVTPYLSTPGRKVWVLVRDRAAPNHPVIGIASFGNAVVHQGPRDELFRWNPSHLLTQLDQEANKEWAAWLIESLQEQFDGVYLEDFLHEGIIDRKSLKQPTGQMVEKLRRFATANKKDHSKDDNAAEYDRDNDIQDVDWLQRARMSLFRWKRAEILATLLDVRKTWQDAGFDSPDAEKLKNLLKTKLGKHSIELLLRRVKSDHVGIDMLEITTCGAIAPYNHILGGKLVAMLLASPEIIRAYGRFYGSSPSVIASSIAGRAVCRKPNLVYLGTTSLYGVGSSQYNRVSIPAEQIGGRTGEMLRYHELGYTEGFGCTHFSPDTSNEIEALLEAKDKDRRINSIFGEGISPRMRKMRVGLDLVGLPSQKLLHHGSPRIVYGLPLATNFRDVLLGRQKRPKYILPVNQAEQTTKRIADYWIQRWLSMRIDNEQVLAEVEQDTLILPITHRARVVLPGTDEPSLFSFME